MAKEKLLTEANCKAAKASTKMYYLNDGGGLRLRVQTNGSRNWLFRYKVGGKEKTAGLINEPSAMNARVVIRYDEPNAVLSIRSAKLVRSLSLIASDLIEKKTLQAARDSR